MQLSYAPQINTKSTRHAFVITQSLTLYWDMYLIDWFSQHLTLLSIYFALHSGTRRQAAEAGQQSNKKISNMSR